jgi:large subunit ribosomal protein L25
MNVQEEYNLEASIRDLNIKPADVRRSGQIPVSLYGKDIEPKALAVNAISFRKLFGRAGESALVKLIVDGESPRFVLFKEPQFDPRTNDLTHIDFYQVNLTEKITAEVPLVFVGEAPALASHEAILVTNHDEVEVECLPRELPHEITVDISGLANIDDQILFRDLQVPSGVEVLDDPDGIIVLVAPHREEEVAEVSEAEAIAGVEATAEKPEEQANES